MPKTASKITTDHTEIKQWAERHGGRPVSIRGTGGKDDPGVLRIDFPNGAGDDKLEPI